MNTGVEDVMKDFIIEELTRLTYGEEVPHDGEAIYSDVSGIWHGPDDNYVYGESTKRRVYPVGSMRKGCRNELYYGTLGMTGVIPKDFHVEFNDIVKKVRTWILFRTCDDCDKFSDHTHATCPHCEELEH